jgi:membrane protease YdiL (CAAX protease family)
LLALIIAYFTLGAAVDMRQIKRLLSAEITGRVRCKLYRQSIISGWAALIVVLVISLISGISLADIGLRRTSLAYDGWFAILVLVACGLFAAVLLYQMTAYLVSEKYRQAVREQLINTEDKNYYDRVVTDLVMPRSRKEKTYFFWLSLTAGISEEILDRGCLFCLLPAVFPGLPLIAVVAISSLVFGFGHIYQGPSGMLKTSLIGVLFACLFVVTGSLLPGILLHFLADVSSNFLLPSEPEA